MLRRRATLTLVRGVQDTPAVSQVVASREGVEVSMGWFSRNDLDTRERANRPAVHSGASSQAHSPRAGGHNQVEASSSGLDRVPLDVALFDQRYQDIQVLRKIADGRLSSVKKEQLSGVLAPLAESLTRDPYLKEVKRWSEVFADVFVGLDSFKLQLDQGIPFSFHDFDLSEDSARIALDALTRRLLKTKVAA